MAMLFIDLPSYKIMTFHSKRLVYQRVYDTNEEYAKEIEMSPGIST